jgi:signal peptidase I
MPKPARLAYTVAFVLVGICVLGALFGHFEGLLPAVFLGIGGLGIYRGRVWSAYGLALFEMAQLTALPVVWIYETISPAASRNLAATAVLNVLLTLLFFWAGRSLASSGTPRGHAIPWIVLAAVAASGSVCLIFYQPFSIPSAGMENTVLVGDRVFVRRSPGVAVQRGDVIAFRYPADRSQSFLKRVVGVPGDHVRLVQKVLYVNGTAALEPYAIHITRYMDPYRDNFPKQPPFHLARPAREMLLHHLADGEIVVPEGNYFVMGDNRDDSLDSRYWGFVPQADIIGKPVLVYWSLAPPQQSLTRPAPWEGTIRWNRFFKTIG